MTARVKRPAFQFYPGDWRRDAGLRACSLHARGLWIEMLCLMHDAEPYGHLVVGDGQAVDAPTLARMIGESAATARRLLGELEAAGVFSRTPAGVIYSRRMVKDEHIRTVRAAAGKLGGNPNLVPSRPDNRTGSDKDKGEVNQTAPDASDSVKQRDNQKPTPAVAVASAGQERLVVGGGAREARPDHDRPSAPPDPPDRRERPSDQPPAVRLARAANQGARQVVGELADPLLASSGGAAELAAAVAAAGIPVAFACRAVFTLAVAFAEKAQARGAAPSACRPGSLTYFAKGVQRAAEADRAQRDAAGAAAPEPLPAPRAASPGREPTPLAADPTLARLRQLRAEAEGVPATSGAAA